MICKYCYGPVPSVPHGRQRDYCCNAHKQSHYRLRKNDYQRQRVSASLRALTLRNDLAFRNANLSFDSPSAGAGVFQQVDWTA